MSGSDSKNREEEPTTGGIFRVQPLRRSFYVAARARDVSARPLAVEIWGTPLVLYRNAEGRAVALLDRCPHRNVPLSAGRVCAGGELECPYHGWRFASSGQCVEIPGRVAALDARYRVLCFEVREDADFVWVCPSEQGPISEPFALPHRDDPAYTTVIRSVRAEASLYAVIENALDVPHTAVLHRGLFRGGERRRVHVRVTHFSDRIEAAYQGEPLPEGILARLLSLGGPPLSGGILVEHWDRFFLPSVLQVEYRLGQSVHFVITGLCVPINDHATRIFAVASFRTPLPGRLLAFALEPVARWVFSQDARLLAKLSAQTRRFGGEHFVSTELDAIGPGMWRLFRRAKEREEQHVPGVASSDPESEALRIDEFEMEA